MDHSNYLQECLKRMQSGDESARDELINESCDRLRQIAHTMLGDYRRLRRWEETDDILQNAILRLCRTLQQITPKTMKDFYRLATLQIRRELIDLSRHHFGPEGKGAKHATSAGSPSDGESATSEFERVGNLSMEPSKLASWSEFHTKASTLPHEMGEVFDLVWYQGLTHAEAAAILDVSTKTVQRRWHSACLQLHDVLGGQLPN